MSRKLELKVFSESVISINFILQQVVDGNEIMVRKKLESIKQNKELLSTLLSSTGTAKDYCGCKIKDLTLLQAAAAALDNEMCELLINYMEAEQAFSQLSELFPEGIEIHDTKQRENAFEFDEIQFILFDVKEIDLDAVRDKKNNGSELCRKLEEFHNKFSEMSLSEKRFNPYHLLKAFETHRDLVDQWLKNKNTINYRKIPTFLNIIMIHIGNFVPMCYRQAFYYGLKNLVKVGDHLPSPRPFYHDNNMFFLNSNGEDVILSTKQGQLYESFCQRKTEIFKNIMLRITPKYKLGCISQ